MSWERFGEVRIGEGTLGADGRGVVTDEVPSTQMRYSLIRYEVPSNQLRYPVTI